MQEGTQQHRGGIQQLLFVAVFTYCSFDLVPSMSV